MTRNSLKIPRLRKVFGEYVQPAMVESLLRGGVDAQSLKHGHIEFVLAFVRGESPTQVSERIGRVAEIVIAHGATVHTIVGALVVAAFVTTPGGPPLGGVRPSLVHALTDQLAGDVKVVHGAADGHYGLFGSETGMSFTFLVPQFDQVLGRLSLLPFGAEQEFRL
jgi:hypothetical protein